ncbi:hypothetical protein HY635_02770 [Candidatus Uhrbacteria bacterium]|nr:hypothetical protein [Candidatus Uhrbacteria bacterium]
MSRSGIMLRRMSGNAVVLVGVLKSWRDLELLRVERWYRIPAAYAPSRRYTHLAFYQPAAFGRQGKRIRYYARVLERQTVRRNRLLPEEAQHPRAREPYVRVRIGKLHALHHPIRNIVPRRVTFGFTTLDRLRSARDMLQLYHVTPIEQMMEDGLRRAGIHAIAQRVVVSGTRRCRLDFAVPCRRGAIAIECDNRASHRSPSQRARDKHKDAFLRRLGWTIVRLPEHAIVSDLAGCIARVRAATQKLGACLNLRRE